MKVKWVNLVDEMHGNVDQVHYARGIPGQKEWAAVCSKPELSDATKKKRAAHPTAKHFAQVIAVSKEIMHTPELRSTWQTRYDKAQREAARHNKSIQGRLCDFVRHEVSAALKRGENPLG